MKRPSQTRSGVEVSAAVTLPAAEASPAEGLNFIWNPNWGELGNARVWLAAAGQMFFTLSVGMGSIHTYASYLRRKDDVTLTGLSTASTNEFAEVVLGGTIAIPAAVVFFGVSGAMAIANNGAYDLGIVAMGVVFQGLPGAEILGRMAGFLWYFLLFIAGVTSCVALASPAIAFLQDEFKMARKKAAWAIASLGLVLGLYQVVYYNFGVLSEWDFWAGTFGLVVFATLEILLFDLELPVGFADHPHGRRPTRERRPSLGRQSADAGPGDRWLSDDQAGLEAAPEQRLIDEETPMTSFALTFMLVSMSAVTLLTGYCMTRILKAPPPTADDD